MNCYACGKTLTAGARACTVCGQPVYITAASTGGRGRRLDGCLADTRQPTDYVAVPNLSSLPPRVDLRPGCSPVEDQGHIGSCTANAIVGAVELKQRKAGRQDEFSRLFVYYNARRLRGREGRDCGAPIGDGMAALLAHGVPPERAWPYAPDKVTVAPDPAAYDQAMTEPGVEYARVEGLEHIKGSLARGFPVVFAISLPESCYDQAAASGVMPAPGADDVLRVQTRHGRHAMLLVGYDANDHFFRIRNSWGPKWGEDGYCRLSIDTFQQAVAPDSTWILGPLATFGDFTVSRPALARPAVEGGVRDRSSQLRDELRARVSSDIAEALRDAQQRVTPPRGPNR